MVFPWFCIDLKEILSIDEINIKTITYESNLSIINNPKSFYFKIYVYINHK